MECDLFKFAYIDESGDNGAKGSKYLILTLMCTLRKKQIIRVIRNTKQILLRKNRTARWLNKMGGEIKYSGFPDRTLLLNTLKRLAEIDSEIYFLAIEKEGYSVKKETKMFILKELVEHSLESNHLPHKIIADKEYFENKKLAYFVVVEEQEVTIEDKENQKKIKGKKIILQLLDEEEYKNRKEKPLLTIKIEHQNSKMNEELQALDLISGAIFSRFGKNDNTYFNALENKKLKIKGKILKKKR